MQVIHYSCYTANGNLYHCSREKMGYIGLIERQYNENRATYAVFYSQFKGLQRVNLMC